MRLRLILAALVLAVVFPSAAAAIEEVRVAVLDPGGRRLGAVTGIPAGGSGSPWSAAVNFARPAGAVLTVVVSTGGHVAEVERFAVTGVRASTTA